MLSIQTTNNETISDLTHRLENLKQKFSYYQKCQENAKRDILIWDPYDGMTKYQHETYWKHVIEDNRFNLNWLQAEIKEVRKQIKQLNREQNAKNKVRKHKTVQS